MSETKSCAHCGAIFARVAGQSPHNWNRRRFCCQWCASQATAVLQRIPREETEKFIALIKAGKSQKQAALETGRSLSSLLRAALTYGLMAKSLPVSDDPHRVSACEMLAMSRAGLERREIAPETRLPAPAGSEMSWGALNTGMSWARACELVAHLRPH